MEPTPWPIRPITDDEYPAFIRVLREALLSHRDPFDTERSPVTDIGRTLAAFDGDRIVGTTLVHALEMAMPGGLRRVAGVSAVGVWPTHRRRGLLTALMRRQLADVREAGESTAALFASEGGIYGRFGYGPAAPLAQVRIGPREAVLRPDLPHDPALEVRFGAPRELRAELAAAHDAALPHRWGTFRLTDAWWQELLKDGESDRGGRSALRVAVAERDGGPRGLVLYRTAQRWRDQGTADSGLDVEALHAADPAAAVLLWRHVLERDLVGEVRAEAVPVDDPVFRLFTDPYQVESKVRDGLWLRLVDLRRALAERPYAAPVDTVLEVSDRDCPWNAGRWRLRGGPEGAECARTDAGPDVRLDTAHLASAYLGGHRLSEFADAGLVEERSPGAVTALDLALTPPRAPHCPVVF
ncbi:GNAT family N-acetyltransferase [Nocardiopsis potens]|uniref:GNAT family N-acetyltransferase n=1 Tax=Nocardiopsis potens TaxID=1246458 RepID=UPI000345115F|nr:GNAT family N-acetyltransferase [Nocardiopsis potens]